jgi:hypothetical protein
MDSETAKIVALSIFLIAIIISGIHIMLRKH